MVELLECQIFSNSNFGYCVSSIGSLLIPSIPVLFGILAFNNINGRLKKRVRVLFTTVFTSFQWFLYSCGMLRKKQLPGIDDCMVVDSGRISQKIRNSKKRHFRSRNFFHPVLFRISITAFKIGILVCVLLFVIFPVVFKYSYTLQRAVVFLNFVNVPANPDYQSPQKYLKGSRNFVIKTDDDVTLGAWQILPSNLESSNQTDADFFETILDNGQNVVIYNHGNGGSRVSPHRIETYQVLRKYFHVITFDYRSYGDSSKSPPSELGLVNDILNVYRWVRNRTTSNVFIWGHSLGTSLSSHSMLKIQLMALEKPVGLILESPFNNMKEEISEFPLATLFKFLPWFRLTVVEPMSENFSFETDKYICSINVPIMILHAEDDRVVPFRLGYKLYKTAQQCRHTSQGRLVFYSFSREHKFGHKFISRASDLPDKISNFIQLALETKTERRF